MENNHIRITAYAVPTKPVILKLMSDTERLANLTAWTKAQLKHADISLQRASSDASFRSYWRVHVNKQTYIVMDAPPDKEDLHGWLDIATRLRAAKLHAPEIFAQDLRQGFLLLSDLGTRTYLPELLRESVAALYADALNALFVMQTEVKTHGLAHYDEQKLVAEMELFPTWFLGRHFNYTPTCNEWDIIEAAFRLLLNSAETQPQVFVHRDYHSRNLLITEHNNPGIIDFQDAVIGPVTYDLVSLQIGRAHV